VKLYNLDHSPYATRVRIQAYKKSLAVDIQPPPVALGSPEYSQRFPLGKIPVLELDDGSQVPDSWVIMEYLEDTIPEVSLRPDIVLARADMRALARYADTCLGPAALFPLFASVSSAGDPDVATPLLAALDEELARLERLLLSQQNFRQRELHLGDIALAPHLDYVLLLAPMFGKAQPLAAYPQVQAWWEWVVDDAAVARGSNEMREAVKAFFGG
jgi:glutathione S-transferase